MKSPMSPVMVHILEDEEACDLSEHEWNGGERNFVSGHAEVATDRVKDVDQREFAGEVGEEDHFGTFPKLGRGDVFVLDVKAESKGDRETRKRDGEMVITVSFRQK